MSGFEMILADTSELRREAFRFRYRIYVETMKRRQFYVDHDRQIVEEPLDQIGRVYLGIKDGRIIGTIRGNSAADTCMDYYRKLYRLDRFSFRALEPIQITTKLMIDPEYAGTTYGPRLISSYAAKGYTLGVQVDFIDCNRHLIPFFEKMGYFSYTGWRFHKEYGSVRPMFFPVDTVNYLRSIRSFLAIPAEAAMRDGQYGGYEMIRRFAAEPAHVAVRGVYARYREAA